LDDMTHLRAALFCEYAATALRASNTYESAGRIYGFDPSVACGQAHDSALEYIGEAASILGFEIVKKEIAATEPQVTNNFSTAGEALTTSPVPILGIIPFQDTATPHYSAGLSRRLA
jgi:hypothetical protein